MVEHDEDIINAADHIIDLGPGAGSMGGTIVGQGNLNKIVKTESLLQNTLLENGNPCSRIQKENYK